MIDYFLLLDWKAVLLFLAYCLLNFQLIFFQLLVLFLSLLLAVVMFLLEFPNILFIEPVTDVFLLLQLVYQFF